MMTQLSEEEQFLLLGKVADMLAPKEEIQWAELVRSNPAALSAYEQLLRDLPAEESVNSFAGIKNKEWKDLYSLYKRNTDDEIPSINEKEEQIISRKISLYKKWSTAAAIIIFACISTVVWKYYFVKEEMPLQVENLRGIHLKTANGAVIDLSSSQGTISTSSANFNNKDNTLSYSSNSSVSSNEINTLTVPMGMNYKIDLNDGTEIWLNSETRVDFPTVFSGSTREIIIGGEAYLKVAHDSAHPFIVHLPGSTVQVLGTQFNVNTYDSGTVKVALVKGKVNITTPNGSAMLVPGKEAVYTDGKNILLEDFDTKTTLSWREGRFYFNGATLSEINKVVPRWFGIHTVIDNPSIDDRQFAGELDRNKPIQSFLDDLKTISRIDSYFDKDSTLHFR